MKRTTLIPGILLVFLFLVNVQPVFSQNDRIGDVNNDLKVNIVDALCTAKYYIGLNFAGFNRETADVDGNNIINIVDAFLIAQYYVGLRTDFPVNKKISSSPISKAIDNQNQKSWKIVWEDHFNGQGQPNPSNWNYHVGNGYNNGSSTFGGWGNGEWEWYRPENAFQENGHLVIKADYHSSPTRIANRDWYQFSSRITTQGKHSWKYGRFEARIALPSALGTWPAFWMLGSSCDASYASEYHPPSDYYDHLPSNWPSCGEIDIMEHRNNENLVTHNLFWDNRRGNFLWQNNTVNYDVTENIPVGDIGQFHLYTIEWDVNEIRWYIDREINPKPTKIKSITAANQEEFHKPFFIILNLALQGQFTGPKDPIKSDFPLYMLIDYVRACQRK